jgi:hypothetical protein
VERVRNSNERGEVDNDILVPHRRTKKLDVPNIAQKKRSVFVNFKKAMWEPASVSKRIVLNQGRHFIAKRDEHLNNMGTDEPFRARDKKFHVPHLRKELLIAATVRARDFPPQGESRALFWEVTPKKRGNRSGATGM